MSPSLRARAAGSWSRTGLAQGPSGQAKPLAGDTWPSLSPKLPRRPQAPLAFSHLGTILFFPGPAVPSCPLRVTVLMPTSSVSQAVPHLQSSAWWQAQENARATPGETEVEGSRSQDGAGPGRAAVASPCRLRARTRDHVVITRLSGLRARNTAATAPNSHSQKPRTGAACWSCPAPLPALPCPVSPDRLAGTHPGPADPARPLPGPPAAPPAPPLHGPTR